MALDSPHAIAGATTATITTTTTSLNTKRRQTPIGFVLLYISIQLCGILYCVSWHLSPCARISLLFEEPSLDVVSDLLMELRVLSMQQ